ncbi:MAG: DUF1987 domain-containing protein [Leptospiraceae bacterium]|nr:DUF1987 domain-containing protein [Leptospiraceae bacterium]MCP5492957.1 DUF1987 domain-containing protein [Leptospiraceae bacterium]
MDKIHIEKTKVSPEVLLDFEGGRAEISGESYPENAMNFYKPVFEWIDSIMQAKKSIHFDFQLEYYNTSSSKCIIDILELLEKYHSEGGKSSVKWYYQEDDDDMLESGEEFSEDLELPFELVSYSK